MKRAVTLGVSVVGVLALAWVGLMSYINSQSSTLEVHVAGTVDRVDFYQEGQPDTPVAEIVTHGRDVDTTIRLPQAARLSLLG